MSTPIEGGSLSEHFTWDTALGRFYLSDTLRLYGDLSLFSQLVVGGNIAGSGDILTTGLADDLWLGDTTQMEANFKAYADGSLNISNGSQSN